MTTTTTTTLQTYQAPSGYLLPSIHSLPPFFSQQPNPTTQAVQTENWIRLILSYARHRRLWILSVEDAEKAAGTEDGDWDEVLKNERINRRVLPSHLSDLLAALVSRDQAAYEPHKQTRSVLLYWRTPDEWAQVLHDWATSTGQLNTILTFYEISSPAIPSPLTGIPTPLLKKATASLAKTGRAQIIGVAEGEGVRFFAGR